MSKQAPEVAVHRDEPAPLPSELMSIPRIAIQAFCETPGVAKTIEAAAGDRRMAKAHVRVHMGGLAAAIEFYSSAPTPNLIVVESKDGPSVVLQQLERLSEVCDAGTKVVLAGHINDVVLYRELTRRGISEYLVVPFDLFDLMRVVNDLYHAPAAGKVGRSIAVIGAKGGCGASTIAHNLAFAIAHSFEQDVVLADLDLAFGTAGLDFNQDPAQGISEAVAQPDRLDDVLLDRLLSKCADHLSLLAAPATLERAYDFTENTFEPVVDTLKGSVPVAVLDLPHLWTAWVRRTLRASDEVVLVAAPDLANLRNGKNMVDFMRQLRPNDSPPRLVLNQVGLPKRPEIKAAEFARGLGLEPLAVIPFDAHLFGLAANNGQMIAEADPKSPIAATFRQIAQIVTGRGETKKQRKSSLAPFLAKLRRKSA